ncbi:MbnP family protein [Sorangium cellulosum]|uniref:MbnP family protein n=1 Tax=Sorangium cellulosum TaxID=56 RepID=UPI000321DABD|nr:MbnP family protein [Sorangium cellulosum]
MKSPGLFPLIGLLLGAAAACGTSSKPQQMASGTGGAGGGELHGSGGAGNTGGAGGQGGAGGAGGQADAGWPAGCAEQSASIRTEGAIVELAFELVLGGEPFLFGEPNVAPDGSTVTPLNVRFYVSHAALIGADGDLVPVDIVGPEGAATPYGVHFYNAEDPGSATLRLRAPAGSYEGVSFVWGLHQACNTSRPETNVAPLSEASQMTWPHTGYLFLRYEGSVAPPAEGEGGSGDPDGETATVPPAVHMGGNLAMDLAPRVEVRGALSVPASGSTGKVVRVVLDEVFAGATADIDLTGYVPPPGPVGDELYAGERLRRGLPDLTVFSFGP